MCSEEVAILGENKKCGREGKVKLHKMMHFFFFLISPYISETLAEVEAYLPIFSVDFQFK